MEKRRVGRYPRAFRLMAVDRLRKCDNVVALSEELGVHRRLLYKWRQQLDPPEPDGTAAPDTREFTLTREICQLKRLLAEKVQEVDFFRGALQKVEARRRNKESTGARASTTRSGK
jgi:transposase-like protein